MTDFDPMIRIALSALLWAWLIVVLYKSLLLSRQGTVGLPLAFVLSTTLLHVGALVHLIPTYDHTLNPYLASWSYTQETVAAGFEASVLGILGFTVGVVLANRWLRFRPSDMLPPSPAFLLWTSKLLIAAGVGGTLLSVFAGGFIGSLPGLTAILGGFKNLLLLGVCGLILHFSLMRQRRNLLLAVIGGAVAVVGVQMFTEGILGDSVAAAITIISFALILFRRKTSGMMKGLIVLMAASYLMLVAAVGWLDIRGEVRASVWGQAGMSERVGTFVNAVSNIKIFDAGYQTHLEYLDTRMNHNVIIGKAVEQLTASPSLSANGETILLAVLGWVPRAIWRDKPTRGGSDTASLYTGQRLSDSSSFGTGPIFEFFINFRNPGVLIGMLVYGFILRWLDIRSVSMIKDGNLLNASYFFVAGAAMITPMNTLFFIVNGAVTSAIAAGIVVFAARRRLRRQERIALAATRQVLHRQPRHLRP